MSANGNGFARRRRARKNFRAHGPLGSQKISRLMSFFVVLLAVGFVALMAVGAASLIAYKSIADDLVAPDELAINQPSYGAKIYDRKGKLLYEYIDDRSGLRRPVKIQDISPALLAATIATEDDSFFSNPGVNIRGLARAVWENTPLSGAGNLFEGSGGSSITQQLVKNVYIGQEVVQGVTAVDDQIRDLKTELQAIPAPLPDFDPERETAELRGALEKQQAEKPSPLTANQLEVLSRLESKVNERDTLEGLVQGERQARSIERKAKEIVYAIELTNRYSKSQILEWYVNQISYGGVYNGIEAASQGYFGKPARDLTLAEAALLAGIPQSPSAYDPVNHPEAAASRRNLVLDIMERAGRIQIGEDTYFEVNPEETALAREAPVDIAVKRFPIEAPHFVLQYVEPQLEKMFGRDALFRDGLIVNTTLDLDLNNEANAILENWITQFEAQSGSKNGAATVMNPKTGEILAMVGSRDYFREDIQGKNNNATALNSPGSAFKPFVYLTTFLRLGWGPGTTILDAPISIPQIDGSVFQPTNPGKNYQGLVTVRSALGNSLNIPPIKAAQTVGVDAVVAQAKKMGFTSLTGNYGPAIATGGVDLTQIDMVYGYSVLANNGVMNGQEPLVKHRSGERTIDPISILKVTDAGGRVRFDVEQRRRSERIVSPEYTYLITSILTDGSSQCLTFGCGGISVLGGAAAVKTGTSEPFDAESADAGKIGDTWGFGYTPDIVVGVWSGNSDNTPIVNLLSTSISFRAMRDILVASYHGAAPTPFSRPEGVVNAQVCLPSGLKPTSLCGRVSSGDLVTKDQVPTREDDWWKLVKIDTRNNLLAGPNTPPQFTEERAMLVPPESEKGRLTEFQDAGYPIAPTEVSNAIGGISSGGSDLSALIVSPPAGANLTGTTQIIGRAASEQFEGYKVEYGVGTSPRTWRRIFESSRPVESGTLTLWDVSGIEPGVYTIRLVVSDDRRGNITSTVTVMIGNGGGASQTPGGAAEGPGSGPNTSPTPAVPPGIERNR